MRTTPYEVDHVNYISPNKKESEDAWIMNHEAEIYGVLDGATPLDDFEDENHHNGAYLAAQLFKNHFEQLTHKVNLREEIRKANAEIYNQMIHYQVDTSIGYKRWSTCVAIVQLRENEIEYAQLGDSMILAHYADHASEVLTKDTVKGISERSAVKRQEDRRSGEGLPEESYYQIKINQLRYNRSMANTPAGYSVANGMEAANDYLAAGRISRQNVKEILMISDGLFHPDYNLLDVFQHIQNKGLAPYVEELTLALEGRSLPIDDRTAVRVTFSSKCF